MSLTTPYYHFHIVTLFPDVFEVWLRTSIIGKALEGGLFNFTCYQLRDFSIDKHRTVDAAAYGGGGGMVLRLEPLVAAVESIRAKFPDARCVHFSPAGKKIEETVLEGFRLPGSTRHLILVCGHYEGVDQRFVDHWVDEEISLGDFVVSGGELPALALTDALIRRCEGALGYPTAVLEESFRLTDEKSRPLLEYSQFTRPSEYRGIRVPDVLLSGDHKAVASWRQKNSQSRTEQLRPDLGLTAEDGP